MNAFPPTGRYLVRGFKVQWLRLICVPTIIYPYVQTAVIYRNRKRSTIVSVYNIHARDSWGLFFTPILPVRGGLILEWRRENARFFLTSHRSAIRVALRFFFFVLIHAAFSSTVWFFLGTGTAYACVARERSSTLLRPQLHLLLAVPEGTPFPRPHSLAVDFFLCPASPARSSSAI